MFLFLATGAMLWCPPDSYLARPRMPPTSRTLRLSLYTLLIIAGAALAATLAIRHAERQALEEDAARANQQLALYANSLHTLIDRYRALPAVLALDPQLRSALAGPVDAELQTALNLKLEKINGAAQSSTLELLSITPASPSPPATGVCPAAMSATIMAFDRTSARPAPRAPGVFTRWA